MNRHLLCRPSSVAAICLKNSSIMAQNSVILNGVRCRKSRDGALTFAQQIYFEDYPSCPLSPQADSYAICKHLQAHHRSIYGGVIFIEACFAVTANASRPSDAVSAFGSPLSLQHFSIQLQVPYWRHASRRPICRRWHTLADSPLPTLSR